MPLRFMALVLPLCLLAALPSSDPPLAVHNDNLNPAGTLSGGTLEVTLRVRETDWRPVGTDQPGAVVYAFAEGGGDPLIPGPLLRVRQGTTLRVTLENPTEDRLVVQGLSSHLQPSLDVIRIGPGETVVKEFVADAEGTYHYWAAIPESDTHVPDIRERFLGKDALLGGAFVVDPAEGDIPDDRIFLMNIYGHMWDESVPEAVGDILVINGRPWPFTERIQANLGDTLQWRLINASERSHPMHLHGFFFQVMAKGDEVKDTLYWPSQRRLAVTEHMSPGSTVQFRWMPDRPGGWIFHCHLSFHVTPNTPLGDQIPNPEEFFNELAFGNPHHDPDHHVEEGMGGLMMAVQVHAPDGWQPYDGPRRQMRLLVQSDSSVAPPDEIQPFQLSAPYRRQFAFILQEGDREPARDSVQLPGSTLILRKGEPTSIWVVNRTDEPTSVHWHGLELDSYFDGVVGVGGVASTPTPAVLPGDSFEVRITPPRAGSFMYHTHINDVRQQSAGLYGPFVILEEDEEWDPEYDKVLIVGNSPVEPGMYLNGKAELEPMEIRQGEDYRFRLMNITLASAGARLRVVRSGDTFFWTPIAKDGADLPPHQRVRTRSEQHLSIGETKDFHFRIDDPSGEYAIELRTAAGRLFSRQPITVIPAEEEAGESR